MHPAVSAPAEKKEQGLDWLLREIELVHRPETKATNPPEPYAEAGADAAIRPETQSADTMVAAVIKVEGKEKECQIVEKMENNNPSTKHSDHPVAKIVFSPDIVMKEEKKKEPHQQITSEKKIPLSLADYACDRKRYEEDHRRESSHCHSQSHSGIKEYRPSEDGTHGKRTHSRDYGRGGNRERRKSHSRSRSRSKERERRGERRVRDKRGL